ncbi:DsbA family protein [Phenylobacterium sp. J367]|uniref:DsbA family protein n=1 Tax=Phenylobacterium sp. J367 TaxID=2898435 RepID=UPI00215108BA|nr:DsbA family protein [Phenylobacterium sp. J367]MCR5880589.1 DsbA family protein [Phenylobacterium sp. J367]
MIRPALASVALVSALALSACEQKPDDAFGQKVRAYLLEHPEVLEEVAMKLNEKKQAEALKASTAAIDKNRAALERDPRDFVANPGGKITVVEFYDYRCSYCKVVAPEITQLIAENPDVRFVFKELPIFGEVSDTAARLALTAPVKAKALDVYGRWMADNGLTEAALDRHLRDVGIDPAQARAAAESPAIAKHIADTQALARALGIQGTPAFIVGDTMIPGADVNALKAAIISARAGDLKRPA